MKNWKKRAVSLAMTTAMTASMVTVALAAETKIVSYDDDPKRAPISVSNVVSTAVIKGEYDSNVDVFTCESPCTVTTLDDLAIFDAYKLKDNYANGGFTYDDILAATAMKITGEVVEGEDGPGVTYKGAKVTFSEKGTYYVCGLYEAIAGQADAIIIIDGTSTAKPSSIQATPTASKVYVNGTETSFDAYNINGNNYFKLRDVAKVVSGSDKQFEVTWNSDKKAIDLVPGKAYTVAGGEMAKGDGIAKNAVSNQSPIFLNGAEVKLTAYTINDNNYFKLRDLGQTFNFNVSWDSAKGAVVINTAESYTAD